MVNFLNALSKEDFLETLTRPDTKWQIVDITNVTFYVTKLKDVALGAPIDLPDNVKFNSGLVNFSAEDHLCFFRCLAVFKGDGTRCYEMAAKRLFNNFCLHFQTKQETSKRPFSDSSSSPSNQPQKRKTTITEDEIRSLFDPEISTDSSTEFEEIRPYADPCCYELIQKCTGHYFACACEKQYYKCKCGWKTIGQEKGVYKCEQCKDIVANCVGCGSFQVKKKGKLFNCENCQCQLTKELYKSLTF